eukprot:jgi/Galph1/535/GphlegSOOS_G5221.1
MSRERSKVFSISLYLCCILFLFSALFHGSRYLRKFTRQLGDHTVGPTVQEELSHFAFSQLEYWRGKTFNASNIEQYDIHKSYVFVAKVENSSLHIPEYVDQEHEYVNNIKFLLNAIQEILKEDNDIKDTVLLFNLLDEPRLPNKARCLESGMLDNIRQHHGLSLDLLETEKKLADFPILSPAVIPFCFHDILVPFGDLLDPVSVKSWRANAINMCNWSNSMKRMKTALFRGSLTGNSLENGRNHRLKLAKLCDNNESLQWRNALAKNCCDFSVQEPLEDGPLCDVAFTEQAELRKENISHFASPAFYIPMQQWDRLTYFILDIDGFSYSRRLAYLCFADVDIIRGGLFDDVLLHLLRNGTDYIHLSPDMHNLYSSLMTLRQDDILAQDMCQNKYTRCQSVVTYENMKFYLKKLLEMYSQQIRFL